jgi:hypothetical protein
MPRNNFRATHDFKIIDDQRQKAMPPARRGSKPARDNPLEKPRRWRAEFFALPAWVTTRRFGPFALSPIRRFARARILLAPGFWLLTPLLEFLELLELLRSQCS